MTQELIDWLRLISNAFKFPVAVQVDDYDVEFGDGNMSIKWTVEGTDYAVDVDSRHRQYSVMVGEESRGTHKLF